MHYWFVHKAYRLLSAGNWAMSDKLMAVDNITSEAVELINPRVKNVTPLADYQLKIVFTNGDVGIYDCRPLLDFGVFKELVDEAYFRQVRAEGGTVVWPQEQDICPDTIYLHSRIYEDRVVPLS